MSDTEKLVEFISNLTPEQVEKILARMDEVKKALEG